MGTPELGAEDIGTVLIVCTGNICRSPFIERVLQRAADDHWGAGSMRVSSGGTRGLEGSPMEPRAHERLVRQGLSGADFRSRRLLDEHVRSADLVLTATRSHRSAVVQLVPVALRHTFTVRELGLVAAGMTPEELPATASPKEWLRSLVRTVAVRRPGLAGLPGEALDIVDPYGQDDPAYDAMADQAMDVLPWVGWALTGGVRPAVAPAAAG